MVQMLMPTTQPSPHNACIVSERKFLGGHVFLKANPGARVSGSLCIQTWILRNVKDSEDHLQTAPSHICKKGAPAEKLNFNSKGHYPPLLQLQIKTNS